MPHFGHTDNNTLDAERAMFMRARLHIQAGRQRLLEGKISLGIVTLYDALNSALQWYVACPEHRKKLHSMTTDNFNDDNIIFDILIRSGVITDEFDYGTFNKLVETALYKNMSTFHYADMLAGIESVMTQLGVMPFDDDELHPDDTAMSQDN
jgi:hypothetical protein